MIADLRESQVRLWPIDRLVPYARNPRAHSGDQMIPIAASIAKVGFTSLIDIQKGQLYWARRLRDAAAGDGKVMGVRP